MSIIPKGSIAFSGFGDNLMRFTDLSGNQLPFPGTAPKIGQPADTSGCTNLEAFASGGYGTTGTDSPDGTTSTYMMDHLFAFTANSHLGGNSNSGGFAVGDHYYFVNITIPAGVWIYTLYKVNHAGTVLDTWEFLTDPDLHDFEAIAVSADEATLYYAYDVPGTNSRPTEVFNYDLIGRVVIGTFVSEPSRWAATHNCVLALPDGDVIIAWASNPFAGSPGTPIVRRYGSDGSLKFTYSGLSFYSTGICLRCARSTGSTPAPLDGTRFVMSYYDSNPSSDYGVSVVVINVASGAVISTWVTPLVPDIYSDFEWDGPFVITTEDIGSITPTVPPAPQVLTTEPCCGSSPSSTPGAGPVEEGTGWSPECNYGGTVPSAADIVDSESWAA